VSFETLSEEVQAWRDARPWISQGACSGMGTAFTGASHAEQVAVCRGTTAPWARPCPVMRECFEDAFEWTRRHSIREMLDGDLVRGGVTPTEMHVQVTRWRKNRKAMYNSEATC